MMAYARNDKSNARWRGAEMPRWALLEPVYNDGERIILKALDGTVAFNGTKALLNQCVERGWLIEVSN